MIVAIIKAASLLAVGYCVVGGADKTKEQLENILALPKRVMTVHELKMIDRQIVYELIGSGPVSIEMTKFCKDAISWNTRKPGTDYWGSPYRLFYNRTLYGEHSPVSLTYDHSDQFAVFSAGQDQKPYTPDDLTSKGEESEDVKFLVEKIEKVAAQAQKKGKP